MKIAMGNTFISTGAAARFVVLLLLCLVASASSQEGGIRMNACSVCRRLIVPRELQEYTINVPSCIKENQELWRIYMSAARTVPRPPWDGGVPPSDAVYLGWYKNYRFVQDTLFTVYCEALGIVAIDEEPHTQDSSDEDEFNGYPPVQNTPEALRERRGPLSFGKCHCSQLGGREVVREKLRRNELENRRIVGDGVPREIRRRFKLRAHTSEELENISDILLPPPHTNVRPSAMDYLAGNNGNCVLM